MTANTMRNLVQSPRTRQRGTSPKSKPGRPFLASNTGSVARTGKDERHTLITQELNHRIKNLLATVQAIARQSIKTARTLEEFDSVFGARLAAIAATNDRLVASEGRGADLRELLCVELEPYGCATGDARVCIKGEPLQMPPGLTLSIGLLFHELITNAVKHGALSSSTGRIDVSWAERESPTGRTLEIQWVESGGPLVTPPTRRGFGSKLLERGLSGQGGSTKLQFDPSGLRCLIEVGWPTEI